MRREGASPAGAPAQRAGPSSGRYEFQLLGPFAVLRDGQPLADQEIGSRKARTLLKRLLVERDRVVSVDTLVEVLWPDRPPDQPDRQVATLASRLRAALGGGAVVRAGEGYRFGGGPAYPVDLDEVQRLAGEAEARLAAGETGLARAAAGRALELLGRGELLTDEPYGDWADPARAEVDTLLRRARRSAWAAALAVRDLDMAVRLAEEALAAEPYHEEACRALMRAHRDRGAPGMALATYERLRKALADELGTDPSTETRELHRAILRAEREVDTPRQAPAPPPATDMVGRGADLALLRDAWSRASAGNTALVLLVGEAGIGKTTLAEEVVRLAGATGGMVARARCYEAERSLFLQPVVDALRPVIGSSNPQLVRAAAGSTAGTLAELITEVRAVIGAREYQPASPEVERQRMFEAVAGFVRGLAERQPVLLFLDDLHLAGSSTLELLHFLMRRVAGSRLLALATARVEEGGEVLDTLGTLAQQWAVGPLPEDAVRELARRAGLTDLADRIVTQTRGHTLSVVETLRAMQERSSGPEDISVPESLRAAVVARMRRAGPQVEDLLRAAAILGSSIDPALLAAFVGAPVEEVARQAEVACQARLLTVAGTGYQFANDLIREITYRATPLPTRIARHRRAAELLAGRPEAVAGHASRAGDWSAATEAYLQAAQAAFQRYAHRDAARLLEHALGAAARTDVPTVVARIRLLRSRVREAVADYQGAHEDQSAVVGLARSQGRPDLELAALRELGGDPLVGMGRPSRECIPYLEAALSVAERIGEVPAQVGILGRLAVLWTNRLRFDRAGSYAERAVALAAPEHGELVRALALDAVKTTLAYRGDVTGLEALVPQLQLVLPSLDPRYHMWAAFESALPSLARAQWPEAAARIGQALTATGDGGYPAYQTPFLAHLAWVERARGRYGEALRLGAEAAEIAERTGHPWWRAMNAAMLGWTLTEVGALDEAVATLEAGLAAAERDATEGYLLRCLGHLAWAYCLRGEPDRAASLAARAEALLAQTTGGILLHGAHATLALAATRIGLGESAAAAVLLEPVRGAAAEAGWVETVAGADLLRARCGDDPERSARLAAGALAGAEQHELPSIAYRAHGLLARLVPGEAAAHHDAAWAIADRLIGSLDAARRATCRAGIEAELRSLTAA